MQCSIIRPWVSAVRRIAVAAMFGGLAWGSSAQANSVTDWNAVTVNYVVGIGVPVGRAGAPGFLDVALVQAAVHDAVQTYDGKYQPYHYVGSGVGSKDAAVAAAAHRILVLLYPARADTLDPLYAAYLANHGLTGDPGLAVGEAAAADLYTLYRPTISVTPFFGADAPGQWRSATPMSFLFLSVSQPFTLESVDQFRPAPPPPMTSNRWVQEYNEAKAVGANTSHPDGELKAVADFWNGDPLPRWNYGLRDLMHDADVGDSARLLALANLATADALMAVFEAKRYYHFWRPIHAIRNEDGNPRTAADPAWTPFITTPNYPEYPSGANGVSGAMTGVMSQFFGRDDVAFSMAFGGVTRQYASFSEAADEVVEVRILQGIHFRSAEIDGRRMGERVARWTWQNALRPTK